VCERASQIGTRNRFRSRDFFGTQGSTPNGTRSPARASERPDRHQKPIHHRADDTNEKEQPPMTTSPIRTKTPASTMSITEAADTLGIGRTLAYELARTGELPTIRLGRRLVVPRRALQRLLGDG
jgi:excisionase family DNA binding protein